MRMRFGEESLYSTPSDCLFTMTMAGPWLIWLGHGYVTLFLMFRVLDVLFSDNVSIHKEAPHWIISG